VQGNDDRPGGCQARRSARQAGWSVKQTTEYGAGIWAATIRKQVPRCKVEVLTPDFRGQGCR